MTEHVAYVVRHADAGARGTLADDRRALTARGRAQADGLAERLAVAGITRLVSSPFVRCLETLAPLATCLDITVEASDALAEGAGHERALAFATAGEPVAICSHGDVIGELMRTLDRRGVTLDDDRLAKGSTWELTVRDGEVTRARYVPPPDRS